MELALDYAQLQVLVFKILNLEHQLVLRELNYP
jgi:hypothetical protein